MQKRKYFDHEFLHPQFSSNRSISLVFTCYISSFVSLLGRLEALFFLPTFEQIFCLGFLPPPIECGGAQTRRPWEFTIAWLLLSHKYLRLYGREVIQVARSSVPLPVIYGVFSEDVITGSKWTRYQRCNLKFKLKNWIGRVFNFSMLQCTYLKIWVLR